MILIVGSTGILGSSVARALASAKKPVSGLVRDAASENARSLSAAGIKLVAGDLKDPASVERALDGVTTVICTASSTLSRRDGDSIETVDRAGVQALIALAEKCGVRDFIYVSFLHDDDTYPLARAKREAEQRLRNSKLNWTILQPSAFREIWFSSVLGFDAAAGKARIYGEGDQPMHPISLGDVTAAVVACVGNPAASRAVFRIGGATASQLDIVRMFETATGRKFSVDRMPLAQIKAARAAATDPMTESFMALFEKAASGDRIDDGWHEKLGIRLQPLAEWVHASVRQLPGSG